MTLSAQAGLAQIDLHSHMIPDSYLEAVKAHGMEMDEGFPIPSWSTEEHLNFMDEAIESLLTITEPSHILYGSDYPYVAASALIGAKKSLEGRLASHGLSPEDVLTNNAARLFGADIPVREYGERIVRLAEIEIYPQLLEEYLNFAKEVGTVSMAKEPGVIGLFSMQDKSDPCKVYILVVYADWDAYQAHLQTSHFKKYKEGTASMVKSLKLIETNPLVTATLNKSAIR